MILWLIDTAEAVDGFKTTNGWSIPCDKFPWIIQELRNLGNPHLLAQVFGNTWCNGAKVWRPSDLDVPMGDSA